MRTSLHVFRWLPITLTLLIQAGCSGAGDSAPPDGTPQAAVQMTEKPAQTSSPEVPEVAPPKPGIQLEEILYRPKQGAAPFIELANAGADPVSLQQLTLMIDATAVPLERAGKTLAPGKRLLVILDGPARVDGLSYHAGENIQIAAEAGHAAILDNFGKPIDEVAWGQAAGAVNPFGGGARIEVEPGASIGRAPGASTLRMPQSWIGYAPGEVTPGAPNPPAAVRGLHPMSGTIMSRKSASLSWFPVPGAIGYRVQVSGDDTFAKLVLDQSVTQPHFDISGLAGGRHVWRVQSMFPGNAAAAYSAASELTLVDGTNSVAAVSRRQGESRLARLLHWARDALGVIPMALAQASGATGARTDTACDRTVGFQPLSRSTCVLLRVPLISQHKDTTMLLLEHPFSSGPHAWDVDHGGFDEGDPSDNANCGLASLAMMNHYAGGDLSQDRIGYEILKDRPRTQGNPENDVMYGDGLTDDPEMITAYAYALGTTATIRRLIDPRGAANYLDFVWDHVKREIDGNRPMLIFSQSRNHFMVVVGYEVRDNQKIIIVNDPWPGIWAKFDIGDSAAQKAILAWEIYLPAGNFIGKDQEDSVTQDSDSDGVVDFDETVRFGTKPNDNDSDSDGVGDKKDIYASVFDPVYGYALYRTGRDEDGDKRPMERDPDSDGGSCKDGEEDRNGNGIYEGMVIQPPETWNFKFLDDSCHELTGHLSTHVHSSVEIVPGMQWGEVVSSTDINVRLKPVPGQPGYYEDDGSTFHYTGSQRSITEVPDCRIIGQSWASASGDFTGDDAGLVQGHIQQDGRLGVHFTAGIPPGNVQGYSDICGLVGSGEGGASHSADFEDECLGDPLQPGQQGYVAGRKIFRFNCHDTHWNATGTLVVP